MTHLLLGSLLMFAAVQQPTPGINFFSLKQDLEIGAESAREAEKSMHLVRDAAINTYLRSIGLRLSRHSSIPTLQYRFRVVNSREIDSVAFPGGAIYIQRGLLELTANEHELAAILAHEIAHAAARHGTSQLSRQLLVQAPASIASGLPVTDGWKDQLSRLGISFGADASFLHYSSAQEVEANTLAVEMLAKAGYAPQALSSLLEKIEHPAEGEERGVPAFVYSHPQSAAFEKPPGPEKPLKVSTEFQTFQASLHKIAPPPAADPQTTTAPELPNLFTHSMEFYKLGYPEGWQVTPTTANGAIIGPPDGIQNTRNGDDLIRGVMFDLYDVSDRPMTLAQATDRLMVYLRQRNINEAEPFKSLRMVPGAQTPMLVSAEPGLRTVMIGKSNFRDSSEIVWIVTRMYYQSLFYIVCVAPEEDFTKELQSTFEQIIRSVQLR